MGSKTGSEGLHMGVLNDRFHTMTDVQCLRHYWWVTPFHIRRCY